MCLWVSGPAFANTNQLFSIASRAVELSGNEPESLLTHAPAQELSAAFFPPGYLLEAVMYEAETTQLEFHDPCGMCSARS